MDGCVPDGEGDSPVEAAEEPLPTLCLSLLLRLCCSNAFICFIPANARFLPAAGAPRSCCTDSEGDRPLGREHRDVSFEAVRSRPMQRWAPQAAASDYQAVNLPFVLIEGARTAQDCGFSTFLAHLVVRTTQLRSARWCD